MYDLTGMRVNRRRPFVLSRLTWKAAILLTESHFINSKPTINRFASPSRPPHSGFFLTVLANAGSFGRAPDGLADRIIEFEARLSF